MSDDPEWFAPKRFGFGAGRPISWQGWLVTLIYLAIAIGGSMLFSNKPLVLAGILVPSTVVFMFIASKTTRGGWRWRWSGEKD
jgi:hypothetical protein